MQPQFGEAVREAIRRRGLSVRAASFKTGIDRFTLADMVAGVVPRMEKVVDLARGFEEEPNRWLALAGYEPIAPAWNPDAALLEGIRRIREEEGVDFEVSTEDLWPRQATPDGVEKVLASIRERARSRRAG